MRKKERDFYCHFPFLEKKGVFLSFFFRIETIIRNSNTIFFLVFALFGVFSVFFYEKEIKNKKQIKKEQTPEKRVKKVKTIETPKWRTFVFNKVKNNKKSPLSCYAKK